MPKRKPGVFIELPEAIVDALGKVQDHKGLPVSEVLRIQVLKLVPEIVEPKPEPRGPGRPARPAPPKLPDDIERGATKSGFAGVYQNGRYWQAFWDKGEGALGVFETPEEAALARYWYNKGRLSVTLDALRSAGASPAELAEAARRIGALPPEEKDQSDPRPLFKVGDVVDYDPIIGEGPKRFGLKIVEGPIRGSGPGGLIFWRLDGIDAPVHQEDLAHATHAAK